MHKCNHCFAVGGAGGATSTFSHTLVEHWNGTVWSILTSPNAPGFQFSSLTGVSCVSATNCVAVGGKIPEGPDTAGTLVEHWNGKLWSIVASPNTSLPVSFLLNTSCVSATDCVAVGYSTESTFATVMVNKTLVEHFG